MLWLLHAGNLLHSCLLLASRPRQTADRLDKEGGMTGSLTLIFRTWRADVCSCWSWSMLLLLIGSRWDQRVEFCTARTDTSAAARPFTAPLHLNVGNFQLNTGDYTVNANYTFVFDARMVGNGVQVCFMTSLRKWSITGPRDQSTWCWQRVRLPDVVPNLMEGGTVGQGVLTYHMTSLHMPPEVWCKAS